MNDIKLLKNQILINTRFVEVDMMQVVHHSKYWVWFEESRFNFLNQVLGIDIPTLKAQEVLMPVIDADCKYKRSVVWDQSVIIDAKLEPSKVSYFKFIYKVLDAKNPSVVMATGSTRHAFVGMDFKLKLLVPEFFKSRVDAAVPEMDYAFYLQEYMPN